MRSEDYIMNSEEFDESERLMLQVDSDELVNLYLSPVINADRTVRAPYNNHFLEIGPGPGHITQSIAVKHPELLLTAVEINRERLEMAENQTAGLTNVSLKTGDVTQLDEPSEHYRYAFVRFVLEHIKAQQQQALSELFRVLEPGGLLVMQSVDNGLGLHFPESDYMTELKKTMHQALIASNYDPNTGRYLKSLAISTGFALEADPKIELYKLYSHPVSAKELRA